MLGENGAGKSTLLRIAFGLLAPDEGTIQVRGRAVPIKSPRAARALGIGMVHQHFTSIESLTVRENLELGLGRRVGRSGGDLGAWLPAGLDPEVRVEGLGVALRQRLEIAKALAPGTEILLLDEPSAVLTPSEVDELLGLVRRFAGEGGAVALVTHKLPEVFAAADRVTVLRQGQVTLTGAVAGHTESSLAEAMIGEPLPRRAASPPARGAGAEPAVRIGGIAIHPGELVGIAAVEGHGQRELLRRIAGLGNGSGPFRWDGVVVHGPVAFVPEDRTTEGLIPALSVTENLVLGRDRDPAWSRGIRLRWDRARAHAESVLRTYGVVAPGPEAAVASLSGGNQQKLLLARALESRPRILVVENPVRGLDVKASGEIRERLRGAARGGMAVLIYSTDLDEVLEISDRVLVVRDGTIREAPAGSDRRAVGRMMLGVEA